MKLINLLKKCIPDALFLKLQFKKKMGYPLDLKNPKTFNEKLQWLKLYNRNPLYTILVDKESVKKWVANKIGPQYVIPTLGVWEKFDDIDFCKLPVRFVLKCTHDSGGVIVVKDKNRLDMDAARNKISELLKKNYYWANREWPYKNVHPRIIAEEYLEDEQDGELRDYKFHTFDGIPHFLLVAANRHNQKGLTFDYFDMKGNHLDLHDVNVPNASGTFPHLPSKFEEMKKLSKILAEGIPHVRVDFFEVNGRIYFGEMTFYDDAGYMKATPKTWEVEWGRLIKIPV